MKIAEAALTAKQTSTVQSSNAIHARALAHETHELDALHTGLVRHLTAWRSAHDAATERLNAMIARIDSLAARIERPGA